MLHVAIIPRLRGVCKKGRIKMAQKKPRKEKIDQRLRAKVKVGQKPDGSPIYKWASATTSKEMERKKAGLFRRPAFAVS